MFIVPCSCRLRCTQESVTHKNTTKKTWYPQHNYKLSANLLRNLSFFTRFWRWEAVDSAYGGQVASTNDQSPSALSVCCTHILPFSHFHNPQALAVGGPSRSGPRKPGLPECEGSAPSGFPLVRPFSAAATRRSHAVERTFHDDAVTDGFRQNAEIHVTDVLAISQTAEVFPPYELFLLDEFICLCCKELYRRNFISRQILGYRKKTPM